MQMERTGLWTQRGKERVGRTERGALKKHTATCEKDSGWEVTVQHGDLSPVLRTTQRCGMGGEGGDMCIHMADSY